MSIAADVEKAFSLIRQLQGAIGGRTTRGGTMTLTWAGATQQSNAPTVTHGLGKTPTDVQLTPVGGLSAGSAFAVPVASTIGATTFLVTAKTHDESSPAAGTTSVISWTAYG